METSGLRRRIMLWSAFNFLASLINGNDETLVFKLGVFRGAFNFLASLINGNLKRKRKRKTNRQFFSSFNFLASLINGNEDG